MSRILFVEYYQQPGHINFNRIHIDALRKTGADVRLVMNREIADRLPYPKEMYSLIFPAWMKNKPGHPIYNRMILCVALLYIRMRVPLASFDKVVLSYWEEITLGLVPLCRGMYLVSHGNAASISCRLKAFFIRRLARHNHFVVFNERMASPFREHGIRDVRIVSHGCMPPFSLPEECRESPYDRSQYAYVVFHPSGKMDERFVRSLGDTAFLDFLERERILFVLRNKPDGFPAHPNVRFENGFIETGRYNQLLVFADAILIAYPSDFRYQVSGVSFECVSNGKNVLVRYTPEMEYCRDYYDYDPFFRNLDELTDLLKAMKAHRERHCVVSPAQLAPDYTEVLE